MLDLTCGSGAFLFAALNILEPLYEACLERMQAFIDEGITSQSSTGVPPVEQSSVGTGGTGILPVDQCGAGLLTAQPGGTPGPQYGAQYLNPWADTRTHTRNLPHWEQVGVTYFLTFRLADSLPQVKVRQWREERDQWLKHHRNPGTQKRTMNSTAGLREDWRNIPTQDTAHAGCAGQIFQPLLKMSCITLM